MSNSESVRILGDRGPVVVLLPGGAEPVEGFFPGLVEGLRADPGCRVVLYDRPGTGANTTRGSLAGASAALHTMLDEHRLAPAIVVGQSLGGAAALLLARDHPEDVAGLILLDPSAVNDVKLAKATELMARLAGLAWRVPLFRKSIASGLRTQAEKLADRHAMRPECRSALVRTAGVDIPRLRDAADGLADLAKSFRECDLPRVPSVVVTADRKPNSRMTSAHARLADALGARVEQWPEADHSVHLTHPEEVLDVCRRIINAV
ncbi:alpha/beta hydrolase [Rhodococcus sp. IEGM 1354]|uniref:alpha/beta fold hydrolase n=1 Tax=Rhodococcus sp. IEGM 1354 TaxID=3047088 RepID=UPI0024B77A0D|nr:alpha/beta hydrolase [Rhodococcus sp. IEGM 1354]MDI9929423.1 alpha/beta hydrolase [Rhodococcus sp. IEGM 1354]